MNHKPKKEQQMKLIIALLLTISTAHADCTRIGSYTTCTDGRSAVDIGNTRMHSNGLTETRIGDHIMRSDGTSATDIGSYRFDNGPDGNSTQIGNYRMYESGVTCTTIGNTRVCN